MNNVKTILIFLLLGVAIVFTSCDKEKDDNKSVYYVKDSTIWGKWKSVSRHYKAYTNDELTTDTTYFSTENIYRTIEFFPNDTFLYTVVDSGYTNTNLWSYKTSSNKKITLYTISTIIANYNIINDKLSLITGEVQTLKYSDGSTAKYQYHSTEILQKQQ